jgi:glycerophosphoryl diester phosphodiesterase
MQDHEYFSAIQNQSRAWGVQAVRATREADLLKRMTHPADLAKHGTNVYGKAGKECLTMAAELDTRTRAAQKGYLFVPRDKQQAFEQEHPDLVNAAKRQGLFIDQWPIVDETGDDLVLEAELIYKS